MTNIVKLATINPINGKPGFSVFDLDNAHKVSFASSPISVVLKNGTMITLAPETIDTLKTLVSNTNWAKGSVARMVYTSVDGVSGNTTVQEDYYLNTDYPITTYDITDDESAIRIAETVFSDPTVITKIKTLIL